MELTVIFGMRHTRRVTVFETRSGEKATMERSGRTGIQKGQRSEVLPWRVRARNAGDLRKPDVG